MKSKTQNLPSLAASHDFRSEPERLIADAVQRAHLRPIPAFLPLDASAAARGAGIHRDIDERGICALTFDRPGSSVNLFDRETLLELEQHLDFIANAPNVHGLILASAKPNIFIAGADLSVLACMADQAGAAPANDFLATLIELGQRVFTKLASLNIPTLAAIHGACLGGGLEMALACDYRIATSDRATKIGLPETRLGIIPAWGGCTRLPRLIGLRRALDLILSGKPVNAPRAMALGLVDEVVPREQLLDIAARRVASVKKAPRHIALRRAWLGPAALAFRTKIARTLATKTRGNFPALFEALEVITRGITMSEGHSLALERDAILRLAKTPACRNLIRLFFLRERAKKTQVRPQPITVSSEIRPTKVERCAVIGAGVMGAGIAHWLSSRGISVVLRDVDLGQLARGMSMIAHLFDAGVERHALTRKEARDGYDRIFPAATDVPMRNVDLVIEAATEKLELKRDIFRSLAAQTRVDALLATNTSALSITDLSNCASNPERVLGLHFFNPVHRMELVEVVAGERTSADALARAVHFTQQIGKIPVAVRDSPGFVVNRVLMPYLVEAVQLFDRGVPARDIDEAMLDFGMPMGPLRLLDEVGIDVAMHVAETLVKHFPGRVVIPDSLRRMAGEGALGKKCGRGFYLYQGDNAHLPLSLDGHVYVSREELQQRMALLMVNEAAHCVNEAIASAADIDLAMVLGAGFAPFRGGPLRYADSVGLSAISASLKRLASDDGKFVPCALIEELSVIGGTFHAKEAS
jgi:3-hydroxyacyl-CoA dehydrogenase/enoyl-CoA hydratase/3-hydroxybutyryl-CoA epimerase